MKIDLRPSFHWDCPNCSCGNTISKPAFIADLTSPDDLAELGDHLSAEVIEEMKANGKTSRVYYDPKYLICSFCGTVFNICEDAANGPEPTIPEPGPISPTVPPTDPDPTGTGTE